MSIFPIAISGVRLLIDNVDYSDEIIEINLNDDSTVTSSLISTTGGISLRSLFGGQAVNDLFSNTIRTGSIVTIDIKQADGSYNRHPRGYLYVESSNYDVQEKTLSVNVSCGIGMALSLDESNSDFFKRLITEFVPQSRLDLLSPDAEYTAQLLSSLLRIEGEYLYQDKWGYIQKGQILGVGGYSQPSSSIPYRFASVDTQTCLDVSVQSGTVASAFDGREETPVTVRYEYQVAGKNTSPDGTSGFVQFASQADYEAYIKKCVPSDETTTEVQSVKDFSRSENHDVENPLFGYDPSEPPTFDSIQEVTSFKKYKGPGKQVSYEETETLTSERSIGDYTSYRIFELTQSFFAPPVRVGSGLRVSSVQKVKYKYGRGGELKQKETKVYEPNIVFLGSERAIAQRTRGQIFSLFFLKHSSTSLETYKYANPNSLLDKYDTQITENFDWKAKDKGEPWYTIETRRSAGNLVKPSQQDKVNVNTANQQTCNCPPGFVCEEQTPETEDRTYTASEGTPRNITFSSGLSSYGLPKIENTNFEDFPVDYDDPKWIAKEKEIHKDVDKYTNFLHKIQNADKQGFTIQESMRPEFYSYYPGFPYQLFLEAENKAFSMRTSAATWSLSSSEAVVSFESMAINIINGYTLPTFSENNQLQYYLPPVDSPTTANKQITAPDVQATANIRFSQSPGSLSLPPSLP